VIVSASAFLTLSRILSVSAHDVWVSPSRVCLASLSGCDRMKASDEHGRDLHHPHWVASPTFGVAPGSDGASVSGAVSASGDGAIASDVRVVSATCATRVYARARSPL